MIDWRQSLAGVDEDYLVGISNKGIVKRAHKDLEAEGNEAQAAGADLDWDAQDLTVTAGGETVTIRFPLGESRCSCPSRSICRHVIMAILLAQRMAANGDDDAAGDGNGSGTEGCANQNIEGIENGESSDQSAGGSINGEAPKPSAEGSINGESPNQRDGGSAGGESSNQSIGGSTRGESGNQCADNPREIASGQSISDGNSSGGLGQQVWQEILARPRKPLLKALGSRGLRRLAAAMEAGDVPQVERGTVVRIQLPGQDMTVKLLSPLEYSTCTCHKKELCSHKAEAILWCQYLEKQLTAQDLTGELEQEPTLDLQELRDTAGQVKDCLEHLLETGLARSGVEQAQELERLAILCHNAGLPGWEGDIRALAEGYEKYLRRAAGQTMEKLAGQLQRLYSKTLQLVMLVNEALFKNEDAALNQSGQGLKPQAVQTERAQENKSQTAQTEGAQENRPQQDKPHTTQPGSGRDHRADTVSQRAGNITGRIQALAGEFRAEYLPVGDLELTGITVEHFVSDSGYEGDTVYFLEIDTGTWYTYTNARPTFYEGKKRRGYQEKAPAPWGVPLSLEGLASVRLLLRGAKCDAGGRLSSSQETRGEILGKSELTAAKLEGWYYREYDRLFAEQIPMPGRKDALEKISGHPRLVFVQASRFEQGKFNEITQKLELPIWDEAGRRVLVELPYTKRDEESIRYLERLKKKQQPCFLGRIYLQGSQICLYPVDLLERKELAGAEEDIAEDKSAAETAAPTAAGAKVHDIEACQVLQSYLEEISWLLQEIYQVGSATVQDSTLEALRRAEKQGAGYGMEALSDWLRQLRDQLSQSRHRLRHQPADIMDVFCRLWQYVQLCRQRTAYDVAGLTYRGISG